MEPMARRILSATDHRGGVMPSGHFRKELVVASTRRAKRLWHLFAAGLFAVGLAELASAQWLKTPLRGTPRTADGTPDLTAPTPRTAEGRPNLSGIWRRPDAKYMMDLAADGVEVPFQPWTDTLYKQRRADNGKGQPSERCLPHGVPKAMLPPDPLRSFRRQRFW